LAILALLPLFVLAAIPAGLGWLLTTTSLPVAEWASSEIRRLWTEVRR
jgi:hypothetical protein